MSDTEKHLRETFKTLINEINEIIVAFQYYWFKTDGSKTVKYMNQLMDAALQCRYEVQDFSHMHKPGSYSTNFVENFGTIVECNPSRFVLPRRPRNKAWTEQEETTHSNLKKMREKLKTLLAQAKEAQGLLVVPPTSTVVSFQ